MTCLTVRVSLPIKGREEYSCPIIMFFFRLPLLITRIIRKNISPKARRNCSLIGRYLPRAEIKLLVYHVQLYYFEYVFLSDSHLENIIDNSLGPHVKLQLTEHVTKIWLSSILRHIKPFSAGIDFRRQNLSASNVIFWRLKSILALKV